MVSSDNLVLSAAGVVIVFLVLALIATAVGLLRRLDERWQRSEKQALADAVSKEPTIDTVTMVLISAAVATVLVGRHRIRRVRRLLSPDQPRTPWSAQGRLVLQGSHVIDRGHDRD
ncbi:MAG: OadG family protein [Candidatus Krumholzibacteriia bacterium]